MGPADLRRRRARRAPAPRALRALALVAAGWSAGWAAADAGAQTPGGQLVDVEVSSPVEVLTGGADAASEGTYLGRRFDARPLLRPGEMVEVIPGVIATQHSGGGKANQYFARGFNLDHGTDFRFTADGVPINFTSHGHGQGYTDLNFLIPELTERIAYRMGTYAAQDGDFAVAGAADFQMARRLRANIAQVAAGSDGYYRLLLAGSPTLGEGGPTLLYGLELYHSDGPWVRPDDYRRLNAVLCLSDGSRENGWALTFMQYQGRWNSTDQIPQRAVDDGRLCRWCGVDGTTGGDTRRTSLSADWARSGEAGLTRAQLYGLSYGLDLWSNFTYALNDPANGDQFEQRDRRAVYGGQVSHLMLGTLAGREMHNEVGVQLQYNRIGDVGLFDTASRGRLSTVRQDTVNVGSVGVYGENRVRWTPWLRTVAGLRYDAVGADVNSSDPANSGRARDGMWSPKLSAVFGPWSRTEFYLNYGQGFHTNDVRGATITVDPATGLAAQPVPLIVKAKGGEIGVRTSALPGVQSTLALWSLKLGSELLYIGDAGTTEPSAGSQRYGVEWANTWTPWPWLLLNANLTWSHAEFVDNPAGPRIPGAIGTTAFLGAFVENWRGWTGGVDLRYFGPRPLTEDGALQSASSTIVNARVGYRFTTALSAWLDVFNLFGARVNDIEYAYVSRLPGEPAEGVLDRHFHPAEPRQLRLSLQLRF